MTFFALLRLTFVFSLTTKLSTSIECQFRFVEDDSSYPAIEISQQNIVIANQLSDLELFECEDPNTDMDVQSRFNYDNFQPEEDDYESAVVCETRNRTIYPKGLNNVRNQWTKVVNSANHIQAIETEECVHQNQLCSESSISRCIQKYVKVYLKAFDETKNEEYQERFYFPSTCACSIIPEKKKNITINS